MKTTQPNRVSYAYRSGLSVLIALLSILVSCDDAEEPIPDDSNDPTGTVRESADYTALKMLYQANPGASLNWIWMIKPCKAGRE